ncbi:hypothetical protein LAZ67_19002593 [Cordylochernes scorpioides]|uniref:Pre-mRNA polyadenylation factor Fip1 domain-containing protein n=1 Tax=Cordylochernes scorpioides TaxID=51811 RepID=A0ABY6LKV9_9ARAC|nr:hypothetical protein LAZ67_19002593 [Cordylochernes scorpioides]
MRKIGEHRSPSILTGQANVEDDDNWLYGESTASNEDGSQQDAKSQETDTPALNAENGDAEKPPGEEEAPGDSSPTKEDSTKEVAETTANDTTSAVKGSDSEEEEDDDDDDEVQITIGDIKSTPPQYSTNYTPTAPPPPVNLNLKRTTTSTTYSSGERSKSMRSAGALDSDLVGSINGIALYEFNLDSLEDKPWRKPGADITDYFNYGFNEDTWRSYYGNNAVTETSHTILFIWIWCLITLCLIEGYIDRDLHMSHNKKLYVQVVANSGKDNLITIPTVNENSKDTEKHRYSSYDNDDYDRKRHRDHDRSKDRDRYDREDRYERERRHRSDHRSDKDDRRSSRRRHHHDDDDHRSSRHKHKRSKRDRDEPQESKSKDSSVPKDTMQEDTTLEEGEEKD